VVLAVSNNQVMNNGAHGIFVSGAVGGVIQNNVEFSSGGAGIALQSSATRDGVLRWWTASTSPAR